MSMFMQILLAHFNEEVWEGHHLLFRILWHLLWDTGSSAKRQFLSLHKPVTLTSASAEVRLTQVSCHLHFYHANHVFWHGVQILLLVISPLRNNILWMWSFCVAEEFFLEIFATSSSTHRAHFKIYTGQRTCNSITCMHIPQLCKNV